MQLGVVDRVLIQQALITGQVRDDLTKRPLLYPPMVSLLYQPIPAEPERHYPLTARLYRNGRFVFPGDPTIAFPRLSGGSTLDLLLRVSAPRYQSQEIAFSLSDADLMLTEQAREIDGRSIMLQLLDAPLLEQIVDMLPEPLHLNGRIVEADNPDTPVANVNVRIFAPGEIGSLQTDANGYFTFYNLPVVTNITLRAQRHAFEPLNTNFVLDYRQPVNQMTFALRHR